MLFFMFLSKWVHPGKGRDSTSVEDLMPTLLMAGRLCSICYSYDWLRGVYYNQVPLNRVSVECPSKAHGLLPEWGNTLVGALVLVKKKQQLSEIFKAISCKKIQKEEAEIDIITNLSSSEPLLMTTSDEQPPCLRWTLPIASLFRTVHKSSFGLNKLHICCIHE